MIEKQRGLSLTAMLFGGLLLGIVAILASKILPDVIEYYKIRKCIASTATNAGGRSVAEIRQIYSRYAEVDHIQSVAPEDLGIATEDGEVIISFAYEKRIPLFSRVSLLIDFHASSAAKDRSGGI